MLKAILKKRNRKGFSLIELLIVIAIIGIIATIAIPLLLSARNNAIDEKARNSLRTVVSAQAAYYAANGDYGTLAQLTGATPPYLDARFAGGDLGQGITVTVTVDADGQGYDAAATGATHDYDATETGDIVES